MSESQHRPPAPPQPNTVMDQPATVQAAAEDYAQRGGLQDGTITATPHTCGRRN